jgi:adenylyltransferase/sulfurtransferase
VLGVLPGIIGTIQATEAIKLIVGIGEPLIGRFLIYDALKMRFRELKLSKDPECPVCSANPSIRELQPYDQLCSLADSHRDGPAQQKLATSAADDMSVSELKARMDAGNAPVIIDVRESSEYQICRIPGATLIPLGELAQRTDELDPSVEVVLQCKSGSRSARATALLRARGFSRARNLTGGVMAWIDQVDPTQPKY